MLNALRIDRTLNRKGSLFPYFFATPSDRSAWLSCIMSNSVLCVSTSFEGCFGWVPIHSSAYGVSRSISRLFECVAAAYLAAADWVPTLPMSRLELGLEAPGRGAKLYPSHSNSLLV